MAAKTCRVSCKDLTGVLHSVEVTAESLYDAIARGLSVLKASGWVEEVGEGLNTITVEVLESTPVKHQVLMRDFHLWLAKRGHTGVVRRFRNRSSGRYQIQEALGGRQTRVMVRPKDNRLAN